MNLKEKGLDKPGEIHSPGKPDADPDNDRKRDTAGNRLDDSRSLRAKGETNADLASSAHNRIAQHAVESYCREHESQRGKKPESTASRRSRSSVLLTSDD